MLRPLYNVDNIWTRMCILILGDLYKCSGEINFCLFTFYITSITWDYYFWEYHCIIVCLEWKVASLRENFSTNSIWTVKNIYAMWIFLTKWVHNAHVAGYRYLQDGVHIEPFHRNVGRGRYRAGNHSTNCRCGAAHCSLPANWIVA